MLTRDLDYDLPQELIAQTPIEPRDAARLLIVRRDTGELAHPRSSTSIRGTVSHVNCPEGATFSGRSPGKSVDSSPCATSHLKVQSAI